MNEMTSIKCQGCLQVKPPTAFYENQKKYLDKLKENNKNNKAFNPATTGYIRCIPCRPQERVEQKCNGCDKVKEKNKFSKQEWKKVENAECIKCVDERQNMVPGAGSGQSGSEASDDGSDDEDGGTRFEGSSKNA